MRLANSAIYSFKRKIKSVKDAVTLMGTREILSLVRLACITGNLKTSPEIESAVKIIWKHSATCAITAKLIYKETDIFKTPDLEDELFICGIIHDIGKIIIWKFFPDIYMSFKLNPEVSSYPLESEEKKILGISHSEVGKVLSDHWDLPESFGDVIGYHHNPMDKPESELVMIIHISDVVSKFIMKDTSVEQEFKVDPELLDKIGYTDDQIRVIASKLEPEIKKNSLLITKMITS